MNIWNIVYISRLPRGVRRVRPNLYIDVAAKTWKRKTNVEISLSASMIRDCNVIVQARAFHLNSKLEVRLPGLYKTFGDLVSLVDCGSVTVQMRLRCSEQVMADIVIWSDSSKIERAIKRKLMLNWKEEDQYEYDDWAEISSNHTGRHMRPTEKWKLSSLRRQYNAKIVAVEKIKVAPPCGMDKTLWRIVNGGTLNSK